ncbi:MULTISPECIES: hypothetical protein [Bacillus subtilis group]|uniref:Uncharacterized protein n=2 Tax=Bacillus subtilis group TaxID=653685 RepID=A0A8I1WFK8_BACIU|nr:MULTISPECIES: hypothetical protein [Bacillus subtilis group]KAF2421668.1 hypothetical protein B6K89_20980 [Bacillus subtilis]MBO3794245.1 hypothetical protein [Bacillus subtilis]MBU5262097.1 hypothetical protein [Bacillus atrophaeus]MCY8466529.1 hypothetical protein [Bacillus atrophaeus]MCY8478988.1 hypothetical protein [Bacillus atrophaeus]
MAKDRLYARIRKGDDLLREHFSQVKESDHAYEVRRLLEKAIKIERKQKEMIEDEGIHIKHDS